jgi:Mg2+ and Co2+ transporter CorA
MKDFLFQLLRLSLIKKCDYKLLIQNYDARRCRDLNRMTIQELYQAVQGIFNRLNIHIAMVEGNHRVFAAAIAHRQNCLR